MSRMVEPEVARMSDEDYARHVYRTALFNAMTQMRRASEMVAAATPQSDLDMVRETCESFRESALTWAQIALAARP
jgi:adenylate kinase